MNQIETNKQLLKQYKLNMMLQITSLIYERFQYYIIDFLYLFLANYNIWLQLKCKTYLLHILCSWIQGCKSTKNC